MRRTILRAGAACLLMGISQAALAQSSDIVMRRPLPMQGGPSEQTDCRLTNTCPTPTPSTPTPSTPTPTPTPPPVVPDGYYDAYAAAGYCDGETYQVQCMSLSLYVEDGVNYVGGYYGSEIENCQNQPINDVYRAVEYTINQENPSSPVIRPDEIAAKNGRPCSLPVVSTAYAGVCGDGTGANSCREVVVTDYEGTRSIEAGRQVNVSRCNQPSDVEPDVASWIFDQGYFPTANQTIDNWCKGEGPKDGDAVSGECQENRTIKMRCVIAFTTGGFREIPCAGYTPMRGQPSNIYTHIEDLEDALGNCEGDKAGAQIDFFKNVTTASTPGLNYRYTRHLKSEYFTEIQTYPGSGFWYTDEPGQYTACPTGQSGSECNGVTNGDERLAGVVFLRHRIELEYTCTDVDDFWSGGDGTSFWKGNHSFPMSRGQCGAQLLADLAALQNDSSSATPAVEMLRDQPYYSPMPEGGIMGSGSFMDISPVPYVDQWDGPSGSQKMPTYSFTHDEANRKIIMEETGWQWVPLPNL